MDIGAGLIYRETALGTMILGDGLDWLKRARTASVDLVLTSPPFALVRKKPYGNKGADAYLDWFMPFAAEIKRVLKPAGSFVFEVGGAWNRGAPTRSLYHFRLLIRLCDELGYYLAQEFYWWNPSRLPSPAEWVTVQRIRVKDAVSPIWWLSPTPWPKASNRRVLAPYSDSMRSLMADGCKKSRRPSGHGISPGFAADNGGSIPPNLVAIANTESNGAYLSHCRMRGLPIHPARFPWQLPAFFIRMLTEPGDLVVGPFAGSCTTGWAAEALGRRWVCIEQHEPYLAGAVGRFENGAKTMRARRAARYCIGPYWEDSAESPHG